MENTVVNRQRLKSKVDTLTEIEAAEVLEYIGIMESLRDDPGDPLTETVAKLLCDAMNDRTGFEGRQIHRQALKN